MQINSSAVNCNFVLLSTSLSFAALWKHDRRSGLSNWCSWFITFSLLLVLFKMPLCNIPPNYRQTFQQFKLWCWDSAGSSTLTMTINYPPGSVSWWTIMMDDEPPLTPCIQKWNHLQAETAEWWPAPFIMPIILGQHEFHLVWCGNWTEEQNQRLVKCANILGAS